jgi:DnaJ-domain-containing protein 1
VRVSWESFLWKAALLVGALVFTSVWQISATGPGHSFSFYAGDLLAEFIAVSIASVLLGGMLLFGVVLAVGSRKPDHSRACLLMGLYVCVLWLVYWKLTQPLDAGTARTLADNANWVIYGLLFVYALPGVGLTGATHGPRTTDERAATGVDANLNGLRASEQPQVMAQWVDSAVGYGSTLILLLFGLFLVVFVVDWATNASPFRTPLGKLFMVAFVMFVPIAIIALLAAQSSSRSAVKPANDANRIPNRDWAAKAAALTESKAWAELLILGNAWVSADRENFSAWCALATAKSGLGGLVEAISFYTVAYRLASNQNDQTRKAIDDAIEECRRRLSSRNRYEPGAQHHGGSSRDGSRRGVHEGLTLDQQFRVLGIEPHATLDEIKAAYRKRIREYHPDKVADLGRELQELAEAKAKEINAAYRAIIRARSSKVPE